MKVVVFTLGCKVNQYDSDALVSRLLEKGYEVSEKLESADVYVLNTCAVTKEAESKSRQSVTRVLKLNENAKIFVCGCASENNSEQFSLREQVVYVCGTRNKVSICALIDEYTNSFENIKSTSLIEKNSIKDEEFINEKDKINEKKVSENIINAEKIISKSKNNLNHSEKNVFKLETSLEKSIIKPEVDIRNTEIKTNYPLNNLENKVSQNINCGFKKARDGSFGFEETGNAKSFRTRHYIKVQEGCDNFCSYCLVPYLRGANRSRDIQSILNEVEYAKEKTKEIVLTGINLSAYGRDISSSLTDLLLALKDCPTRIRLGSLEANVIDKAFLDATVQLKKFCAHFHLSLQSGDDDVLKSMNRKYTTAEFKEKVELIRSYYPDAAITTDIIVGFPTETDEAFSNTVEFVKNIKFSNLHIFSFSPREKTAAYKLKPLEKSIVEQRHKELEKVKLKLVENYNQKFIGRPLEVLFETKKNGLYSGHSENYITVYAEIAKRGELKTVTATQLLLDGIK